MFSDWECPGTRGVRMQRADRTSGDIPMKVVSQRPCCATWTWTRRSIRVLVERSSDDEMVRYLGILRTRKARGVGAQALSLEDLYEIHTPTGNLVRVGD